MLTAEQKSQATRYVVGIGIMFAIVSVRYGIGTAGWFMSSGVIGYVNAFYVLRLINPIAHVNRRHWLTIGMCAGAIALSTLIIIGGYGLVLALATVCFVVVDAAVLRFK